MKYNNTGFESIHCLNFIYFPYEVKTICSFHMKLGSRRDEVQGQCQKILIKENLSPTLVPTR